MIIKCIAIDDEPLALEQLKGYVQKTPFLELVALCKNAFEALDVLKSNDIQLMFIDIDMPDINGLDFVKSLIVRPHVIFTTAYSEYAFEGFQVDAIDYLLKPINYASFLKAVTKSKTWYELNNRAISDNSKKITEPEIFVKSDYKMVKIHVNEIKHIESANEYIKIYLDNNDCITTFMRLKTMVDLLPSDSFMRIHKSFIINIHKIHAVDRNRVFMDKKLYIPVGEQYKQNFNHFLEEKFKT